MNHPPPIPLEEGVGPLLRWYDFCRRPFPWRETNDPYAVWISEVMLQQTQAARGVEYHRRWMRAFPTLRSLAGADEEDVLRAWEGLGYYSRARNLLRAARLLEARGLDTLPASYEELRALPGVGPYTAAAVASIAFGLHVPALDANGKRVFSRLLDLEEPVDRSSGERTVLSAFERMLPPDRPGDFNSAIMELGATLCAPASTLCGECPLGFLCLARLRGSALERPMISRRTKSESLEGILAVYLYNDMVFLRKRPPSGLWAGFEEFPWSAPPAEPESALTEKARRCAPDCGGEVRCSFTKWRLRLAVRIIRLHSPGDLADGGGRWALPSELAAAPLPAGSRKVRERLFDEGIIPRSRSS